MQIINGQTRLIEQSQQLFSIHFFTFDKFKKITVFCIFKEHMKRILSFKVVFKFDDVWMRQIFMKLNFLVDFLQLGWIFFDYFHSIFLRRTVLMLYELNNAKSTWSKRWTVLVLDIYVLYVFKGHEFFSHYFPLEKFNKLISQFLIV